MAFVAGPALRRRWRSDRCRPGRGPEGSGSGMPPRHPRGQVAQLHRFAWSPRGTSVALPTAMTRSTRPGRLRPGRRRGGPRARAANAEREPPSRPAAARTSGAREIDPARRAPLHTLGGVPMAAPATEARARADAVGRVRRSIPRTPRPSRACSSSTARRRRAAARASRWRRPIADPRAENGSTRIPEEVRLRHTPVDKLRPACARVDGSDRQVGTLCQQMSSGATGVSGVRSVLRSARNGGTECARSPARLHH